MTILDVTGNSNSSLAAGSGNLPPVAQRWPTLRVASTGETQVNRAYSGDMAQDQAFKAYTISRSADTNAMVLCDINDARFVNLSRISRYKDILSRIVGDMKLTKPVKGQNLYLTINRKVQLTTQQAILDQIATTRLITQPAGEILQAVQVTDTSSMMAVANQSFKGAGFFNTLKSIVFRYITIVKWG